MKKQIQFRILLTALLAIFIGTGASAEMMTDAQTESLSSEGEYEWIKDVTKLKAGDELVFVNQSTNYLAYAMGPERASNNNFGATSVRFAEGTTDRNILIVTAKNATNVTPILLEGTTGAWYFKTNTGYLYAASSSANQLKTATLETAGDNAKATISVADNGNASVVFKGKNTNRYLKYYSSSTIFSCYSSSSTTTELIQIYRKIKPVVSFVESSVDITYGNNYNKQPATTVNGFSGSIVYSSSDETVVKFHGNNVIDVLKAGTVTITATASATATTDEGSATYTLNIHEPSDGHEINLTFGSTGYLTWVATADIDFSLTNGIIAYQITEATSEGITATEVAKVPKGAAVMLKGSGTVELIRTTGVAALSENKMLACTDASVTGITGNQTTTDIYVLGNGSNGLGYYMLKNTLQAGKGYLNISGGAEAKASFIAFEETESTGISNVCADSADGVYYNLQGVRVLNPQKGIYIKDGRKMVVK